MPHRVPSYLASCRTSLSVPPCASVFHPYQRQVPRRGPGGFDYPGGWSRPFSSRYLRQMASWFVFLRDQGRYNLAATCHVVITGANWIRPDH